MKRMGIRQFLHTFNSINEPIEILRWTETIGFYYPGDVPPIVTPTEYRWYQGVIDETGQEEDHSDREETRNAGEDEA